MCVYLMTMIMVLHSSFSSCLFHTLIMIIATYLVSVGLHISNKYLGEGWKLTPAIGVRVEGH